MTAASIARRLVIKRGFYFAALAAALRWKRHGDAYEAARPRSPESKHAAVRSTFWKAVHSAINKHHHPLSRTPSPSL